MSRQKKIKCSFCNEYHAEKKMINGFCLDCYNLIFNKKELTFDQAKAVDSFKKMKPLIAEKHKNNIKWI